MKEPKTKRPRTAADQGEDKALVERMLAGDERAFEAFLKRYEARIYSFGYRLCGQRQDAEDMAQDVFVSALKNLKGFRWESPLLTWLFRIAAHRCQRMRRLRSGQPKHMVRLDAPVLEGPRLDPADGSLGPLEQASLSEQRERIRMAITRLDPEFKVVLVLRDIEGFSNEEAAKTLGLSVAAVKSRLHRARMQLKGSVLA